ncbi:DPH6 [Cordylochernes scorpioides]|uniref:Diphthine--ammonia ligase n=1 Tax=Cordylochernes scorpioides TaxID=51811 RepID=A0ABY6LLR1_9ARAC|nr:DPH6 [Cordylochernes scorpioides]
MRVVGLVSGGKDSTYNMMQCVAHGHDIVALANLHPPTDEEVDSFMYQSVGQSAVRFFKEAMELPFFSAKIEGTAVNQDLEYSVTEGDEVESLYRLLHQVKMTIPFDAVSVGAIFSRYQRERVLNV